MDTSVYILNELTQGMELAIHLKSILTSESCFETKQVLIHEIISSYDRAMLLVNWGDSGGQTTSPTPPPISTLSQPESSVSIDETPQSQEDKVLSKKRKKMPTWQDQVKISTENGLEGNTDDGYSWRKYGQKTILGAKFPRSYYRCTYQHSQKCMARKQVQRTDADPTVFDITYRGQHTCNPSAKHEIKRSNQQRRLPPTSGQMLSNLKENLTVSTSDLDAIVPCSFSFPSSSFETLENYFTEWGNEFHHHDDSSLSGMISTTASATNSPLAFTADPQDFSAFHNSGFLI